MDLGCLLPLFGAVGREGWTGLGGADALFGLGEVAFYIFLTAGAVS